MTANQVLSMVLRQGCKTVKLKIAAVSGENICETADPASLPEYIDLDSSISICCVQDKGIDGETPIQVYAGNDSNLPKILLLEETEYEIMTESDLPADCLFPYLKNNGGSLSVKASILKNDSPEHQFYNLYFRSYVGKGFFDFIADGQTISIPFEVRSKKIEYRSHYGLMLREISEFAASLLLRSAAPLYQSYDFSNIASSIKYEDFLILEYIMKGERFPSAYEYLRKNMHSEITAVEERTPLPLVKNFNPVSIIDSIRPGNVTECSKGIIGGKFAFFELGGYSSCETIDTPENRLVKDFLLCLYDLSSMLLHSKLSEKSSYVNERLKAISMQLEEYLTDSWISEVGDLRHIPFNSAVLQKRSGYADIFELYLILGTGLKLRQKDAEDLFRGHNKELSLVYEYWCYLKLFDSLKSLSVNKPEYDLAYTDGEWGMTIKSNESKLFLIPAGGTIMHVELYYNREYSKRREKPFQSYSLKMRPDYSLVICPENSRDHSNFIVHFDAKYKADRDAGGMGDEELPGKSYRREDIYRMHTYRDALLRSWGSYILYPGNKYDVFEKYEAIDTEMGSRSLPSIGAVPLVPGDKKNERLKDHLLSVFRSIAELSEHVFDGEFFVGGSFGERKR